MEYSINFIKQQEQLLKASGTLIDSQDRRIQQLEEEIEYLRSVIKGIGRVENKVIK